MKLSRWMPWAALAALLAGCASGSLFLGGAGEQALAKGVTHYENGNYTESERLLESSLDLGLSGRADQVRAHKYLAFIHCASGRETRCRDEFRAAIRIDPSFDLAANEAGHPIWGPVFRSVKTRR